jgi:hypothetical protein
MVGVVGGRSVGVSGGGRWWVVVGVVVSRFSLINAHIRVNISLFFISSNMASRIMTSCYLTNLVAVWLI